MALNKAFLTKLGVDKDIIGDIMDEHGEVVSIWKAKVEEYKEDAEKLPTIQKELDELKTTYEADKKEFEKLKAEAEKENPFEKKYNSIKAEYDKYKADVEAKETKTAKENAVKAYLESKNIKGNNLKLAMKAAKDEINAVEIADGKIKDTAALDTLIQGDFSGLVSTEKIVGATIATPPQNTGGNGKTKQEIMSIKNTAERQAAIAENPELFGLA